MPDALDRDQLLDLLRNLIAIPSVNPNLAVGEEAGEGPVANFARDWLAARGVTARLEEAGPGRPNVCAETGGGDGPTLVLCAHLDTVSAAGMTIAAYEPRVEGNRVYGRGSFDMKGGAAAIMAAAAAIAAEGRLRGRLLLALVADEEYASIGADDFVRLHRADACILTEPSGGELILGHKGFVWAEITTTGRAAHGSDWAAGVSAIGKMGRIITALEIFDREVLRQRVHPLVGPASLHCSQIQGGAGVSTYAPDCTMRVERRTIPGEDPNQAVSEIAGVISAAGEQAQVIGYFSRPPLLSNPAEPVAVHLREAISAVTGAAPPESGVAYWMDAAVFAAAGIPAVNYGPSGAGAHSAVEWVDFDSVVTVARAVKLAAERFCGVR